MSRYTSYFRKNLSLILFLFLFSVLVISGYIYLNPKEEIETIEVTGRNSNINTKMNLGITNYDSMNPHLTKNKDILQIDNLIFEGLFKITNDYNIEPNLIEEWSKISDTKYLFKIKDNVKWSDGNIITTKDIKFTIDRIKNMNQSIYVNNVENILCVEIIDDKIFNIVFKEKLPFVEYQLIFPILQEKDFEIKDNINIQNKKIPTGTGMYKISKIADNKIELIVNENYRNIDYEAPKINEILINIYNNKGEIYKEFRNDNIDLIETSNSNFTEYIGNIGYNKKEYKNRELEYISFNCNNEILCDKNVRKALNCLINKEEIIEELKNKAYISNFPLDYGSFILKDFKIKSDNKDINNEKNNFEVDKEKARKLLNNAGWIFNGDVWEKYGNILEFEVSVEQEKKERVLVANIIKKQLQQFGIKITLKELSKLEYENILKKRNYDILLVGVYNGLSPDLSSFLGDNNLANYKNYNIKKNLLKINENNKKELQELYNNIINIYYDELPYINLYRGKSYIIYSKKLIGDITPNSYNFFYNFNKWYKK